MLGKLDAEMTDPWLEFGRLEFGRLEFGSPRAWRWRRAGNCINIDLLDRGVWEKSDSFGRLQAVDLGSPGFEARNRFAAEFDRIVLRIEPANEKRADAEPVILQHRPCDLLGRAD
jgi:hypothetical protein